MNDTELENLLKLHRERRVPPMPGNLAQHVWREIRRRKALSAEAASGWIAWLIEPFLNLRLIAPALAFALLLGAGLGARTVDARPSPARLALDLQVFSPTPLSLPSTLLHSHL